MVQPQLELIECASLTVDEVSLLHRNEAIIEHGLDGFVSVGLALLDIRDGRLYRETHHSFDAYLPDRWPQIGTRRQADRLIAAAEVAQNLRPIGLTFRNESQVRPLTRLNPDEQPIAWQEAVERSNGQPTAKVVEQVVREMRPPVYTSEEVVANTKLAPLMSSASPEWYTPGDIIKRVTQVLGTIDLDPASSQEAQATIGAIHWCGLDHPNEDRRDGLAREWPGSVYMNPPYGDVIGDWVERLIHQYDMGITTEAIALLPGRIDTAWFRPLWRRTFCAVHGRLKFSGAENSAPFPSIVVYFGENDEAFYQAFQDIGSIHLPIGINQWLKCK